MKRKAKSVMLIDAQIHGRIQKEKLLPRKFKERRNKTNFFLIYTLSIVWFLSFNIANTLSQVAICCCSHTGYDRKLSSIADLHLFNDSSSPHS